MSQTWVPVPAGSDFPVQNLPYGVFSPAGQPARVGVAIGDQVLDLSQLDLPVAADFATPSLNAFMSRGRPIWQQVRARLTQLLTDESYRPTVRPHLRDLAEVTLHRPFDVADYVDFYASEEHATNVGRIFRPDGAPLTPNWKHLPIGYHGRSGTVVGSGTTIVRPSGQRKAPADSEPSFGPSRKLDIEAELGFVVGVGSALGTAVRGVDFAEHVFGAVLVNDWSARDIQAWEYVPLGPFLGKSFATSISPWVVPLDALAAAMITPPPQSPPPLAYLTVDPAWGLDIEFEISWNATVVSRPPFGQMYWTPAQQLAHLTANGASIRTGDLFASGTVSGPTVGERGSFLELTWNGSEPITLADGSTRTFLEDGDTVTIRARARGEGGVHIGFGSVTGDIAPALSSTDPKFLAVNGDDVASV